MKNLIIVFILLVAFPLASYSNQPLHKRSKTKKFVKINKTEFEFGAFKFISPVLAKKNLFIG
jgi:hypothetical protein